VLGNVNEKVSVALHLAQWISPEFAVWANKTIRAVINGDFKALTPEAEKAQAELQVLWDDLRSYTKETFWFVTDSIKNFYIESPREEKFPGQNYQIKAELGISKGGLNRDNFGKNSLKKIEMIQRISEAQIKLGMHPNDACQFALRTMNYKIDDFRE
jgi:hypothetical protein